MSDSTQKWLSGIVISFFLWSLAGLDAFKFDHFGIQFDEAMVGMMCLVLGFHWGMPAAVARTFGWQRQGNQTGAGGSA